MVDVYGNSNSIELLDPRRSLNRIQTPEQNKVNSQAVAKPSPIIDNKKLSRCSFHTTCVGTNVTLNYGGDIAARSEKEFCNGYVFLDSLLHPGESLAVRVLETESSIEHPQALNVLITS